MLKISLSLTGNPLIKIGLKSTSLITPVSANTRRLSKAPPQPKSRELDILPMRSPESNEEESRKEHHQAGTP